MTSRPQPLGGLDIERLFPIRSSDIHEVRGTDLAAAFYKGFMGPGAFREAVNPKPKAMSYLEFAVRLV